MSKNDLEFDHLLKCIYLAGKHVHHADYFPKTFIEKADLFSRGYFNSIAVFYIVKNIFHLKQVTSYLTLCLFREIFEGSTNFKYQNPVKVAFEKIKSKCPIF